MSAAAPGENEPMMEINTTPLIDVMLVLLVMLIITLPPQTHAVKLDMPTPQETPIEPPIEPVVIAVDVDFDGTYYWNAEMIDRATMETRFQAAAQINPQPELHVRPHRLAEYEYVAGVMAAAQKNGMTRIGVIGGTR
jgi:biopolymer transport protein ExbD